MISFVHSNAPLRRGVWHKLALVVLAASMCGGVTLRAQTASATADTAPHHHRLVQQAPATGGEDTAPDYEAPKKEQIHDENEEFLHSPAVQKIGAMLGMKPAAAATAFTIFNFALMAIAVGYLLVKFLPKTFRKRSTAIQKQLVDARTATEEATSRLNSVEERLSKLDSQIAEMRNHAEAEAARDEQRIKASVEDEKVKIVAAAEAEIQSATALAHRQIQHYAAELAIDQAARKLIVTAETDRLLVESFAHRLGSDNGGQN
jgi:F-type H+-transporting ATPase subunit b